MTIVALHPKAVGLHEDRRGGPTGGGGGSPARGSAARWPTRAGEGASRIGMLDPSAKRIGAEPLIGYRLHVRTCRDRPWRATFAAAWPTSNGRAGTPWPRRESDRIVAMALDVVVAMVDVGKLANVGWWRICGQSQSGGRDLDELAALVAHDLNAGRAVALGFEAPLFVPAPRSSTGLGRQRIGEAGRPWSASAGTVALAFGVQQAAYVLMRVADGLDQPAPAGFATSTLVDATPCLVVWEAFVSGPAKDRLAAEPHIADARAAATEFHRRLAAGSVSSDIAEPSVLNLAAAALIAAGFTQDTSLLRTPCVVVKAPAVQQRPTALSTPTRDIVTNRPTSIGVGLCACGCGLNTARTFRPGHDQRTVSLLAAELASGKVERFAGLLGATEPEAALAQFGRQFPRLLPKLQSAIERRRRRPPRI